MKRLLLGCLLFVLLPCQAAVYKWVDERGKVHYGDRPPDSGASQMPVESGKGNFGGTQSDAQRRQQRDRLLDAFAEERERKKAAQRKADEQKAHRKAQCSRARDQLRTVEQAGYLYNLDDKGERRVLSDDGRAEATRRARENVRRWCGG